MKDIYPNATNKEIIKYTIGWIVMALLFISFWGMIFYAMHLISNDIIDNKYLLTHNPLAGADQRYEKETD